MVAGGVRSANRHGGWQREIGMVAGGMRSAMVHGGWRQLEGKPTSPPNNDKRWPEGSPSEKALRGRRIVIRSEVRREQKPEPSHRYREPSKMDRRARLTEEPRAEDHSILADRRLEPDMQDVCHPIAPAGQPRKLMKKKALTEEIKGEELWTEGPGATGPNPPQPWFNRLPHSSIYSWNELAEAFVSRFITNSRKPKEFASLMSMRMKDSESLKNYSARYWEVYNEVDGGTEDMAMKTFKEGLHPESELRHSLSKRSARNMRDLMSRIEQSQTARPPTLRRTSIWIFRRKHSANGPDHIERPYRTNQFGNRIRGNRRAVPLHGNYGTKMAAQVESRAFLFPSKTPFPNRFRAPRAYSSQRRRGIPAQKTYSPCEELETVTFSSDPEKHFKIGRELSPVDRTELVDFLVNNVDVFAWDPYEVPGVDPNYIRTSVEYRSSLQTSATEGKEIGSGACRSMVVKKKNGKWRVCVDFTNLNQACPKDPFPLPKIDQLVDATAGHDRMSFLDAFQGYHQIALSTEDREKTAFITPLGIYCYKVMPFGLKNAGATYQRMDLTETFRVLRLHKLRLNASKCVFGVGSGKFLGFMVSHRGMTAALSRFISRSADRCQPFFQLLKKSTTFKWDDKCVSAFEDLKRYLSSSLLLSNPTPGEPLFLYLAVSDRAKKVGLALITAADKLPQYFQAHTVYLVTQYPVQAMFNKADFTGRIWKWGAKISALGVKYLPRTAIKGQTELPTPKGSGTGVVIITPDETVIEQSIRLDFKTSNNEAEYEAVLAGLKSAKTLEARRLIVYCDSLLVASQINGEYMARDERMSAYLLKVQTAMTDFETVRVEQIGRNLNNHADALATLASVLSADFKRFIPIETLTTPSIDQPANYINTITVGPCWMDPYVTYLKEGVLPEQKKEAEIIKKESREVLVVEGLEALQDGICGSHTGGRSLAHRALTQGYWWPYMQKDAVDYVRKCDKCQRFSHSVHQPAGELQPLVSPWPFAQWGMDLVGPLPKATGNRRWLIVATDYFTKWVEAEPLANIRDRDSIKFVWKNIITRFGIPKTIISDNGTQFTSKPFTKYCSELGIKNVYSSPAYPQSNGQAEASNKTVLDGIKKRLEDAKGRWVEELPNVLWTFRTTPRRSTGETPFSLAYGSEAVIPLEIGLPTSQNVGMGTDKERSGSIPGSRLTRRKKRTSNDQVSLLPAATEKGIQQEHSTEVLSTRRPGPQKSFGQH
uniref:Uncharacterized protein n=1 Tax=Fagus sylvatica TaxID=28930 RepID=A0A2N9E8Q0_FAGSY